MSSSQCGLRENGLNVQASLFFRLEAKDYRQKTRSESMTPLAAALWLGLSVHSLAQTLGMGFEARAGAWEV